MSAVFKKLNLKDQREIAIDEDWSAVRFRRVGFIRTLSRPKGVALSVAGKAKAGAANRSAKPRPKRTTRK